MCEIHAALSVSPRPCSWVSIFDFRDSYVGSVNHCVRGLMYQHAQKENYNYGYNAPTAVNSYLAPHEMYPNPFPYQMIYQQCPKPVYNYSLPAEQKELYLPKTLPVEEPNSSHYPTTSIDSRALEKNIQESFDVWNNTLARELKSVPKFESLLDIDRLEQLCYDDVDNCPNSTTERPKENRRQSKDEKSVQSSMKEMSDGNCDRMPEKASMGSKVSNKLPSASPGVGARPKEIAPVNGKPVRRQISTSTKVIKQL